MDPNTSLTESASKGIRATILGILTSLALAVVKVISGVVGHSYALVADGVESMLDVLSALVVLGGLKIASSPPDRRYPFGYGKAEPLAGLVVSVALLAAAVGIAIQSVRQIQDPQHIPAPFTLGVLVLVVAAKEGMFRVMRRVGSSIGSSAVESDAWHHRSDAITSLAAFVGITIALIGGDGFESADGWAALFACGVIAFNGARLFRSTLAEVMDIAPPPEIETRIREIASSVDRVFEIEMCRIRKSGLTYFVDIHVHVDGDIPVWEGHRIAHEVKDALLESELAIQDVDVHIEPAEGIESPTT
ncbi:MAG: cation transporter [Candidatus Latescibacterota bacterium]|nr:MAG: cation transporter [Candidatus Latescibacterota bacterium]